MLAFVRDLYHAQQVVVVHNVANRMPPKVFIGYERIVQVRYDLVEVRVAVLRVAFVIVPLRLLYRLIGEIAFLSIAAMGARGVLSATALRKQRDTGDLIAQLRIRCRDFDVHILFSFSLPIFYYNI